MVVTYSRREIAELATRLHARGASRLSTPMAAQQWPSTAYDMRAAAACLRKWLAHQDFASVEIRIEDRL